MLYIILLPAPSITATMSWPPLHVAALYGDESSVRRLLAAGEDVDGRDGDKRTALHWAAHAGDSRVAEILLDPGADVDARNVYKRIRLLLL